MYALSISSSAKNCDLTKYPSSLLEGCFHNRALVSVTNDVETVKITTAHHPTLYATAERSGLFMYAFFADPREASVDSRWHVGVYSTPSSKDKIALNFSDKSKYADRDLRCLSVLELGIEPESSSTALVLALGS